MSKPALIRAAALGAAGALALALAGCGGSSTEDASGRLVVNLTDSPVDSAAEVVVVFTGLELKPADGEAISFDFDEEQSIDLLTLQGGGSVTLLDEQEIEAGRYEWIRLKVRAERNLQDGSYIAFDDSGERFPLWVPSGSQRGLQLVRSFVVAAGGVTSLTIDFDVRKSIVAPPGLAPNYILKPTLRLVDNLLVGAVAGDVDVAYLAQVQEVPDDEECFPGVYLFAGYDTVPDDQDTEDVPGNGADPVVYLPLEANEFGIASYLMPFIEAGEYQVAFTCNFDVDASAELSEHDPREGADPTDQTMAWEIVEVEVVPEETAEVNFLPAGTT